MAEIHKRDVSHIFNHDIVMINDTRHHYVGEVMHSQ